MKPASSTTLPANNSGPPVTMSIQLDNTMHGKVCFLACFFVMFVCVCLVSRVCVCVCAEKDRDQSAHYVQSERRGGGRRGDH